MKAKWFNILLVFSILVMTLVPMGGAMAQDSTSFTATPLFPSSTINVEKSTSSMVSVFVKLQGDSLASYTGDIPGLAATSPSVTGEKKLNPNSRASRDYLRYLDQKHQNFKSAFAGSIAQGQVTGDLNVILNAVAVTLPADQVGSLYALPDVQAVYPDRLLRVTTDNSPQFIGAPTVWSELGGQESAGEGVIVGVIDTGVWPEHPSFSDPDPSGKPYSSPPPSDAPRACEFTGGANPGAAFACNNKLIGAYRFMDTYEAVSGLLPEEYTTARDDDGHGTHTSTTAAGNANVSASVFGVPRGTVSGIAPRAHVIAYKVCGVDGCYQSDSVAAIQQAILDGVDVINFSISGGADPYSDAVELAFLNAYDANVFVAASAGNSGPSPETTDHRGPWVTTVAASTHDRAFENSLTLNADGGASLNLTGASITAGVGPAPVFVPAAGDSQCNSPFAAGSVAGMVVVCQRGVTGRAEKGYNVLQGGAVGMILYNQAPNVTDLETDNHYLPTTHIQFAQGNDVLAFIAANTNVQATLTAGEPVAAQGDVMASFSSRGGPGQTIGISKPDITAPGVQILAGHSPQHVPPPAGVALGPQGELFQAIAGTSMSSPHIAGSGALLRALHPDWTPGQIKSALMTTAMTEVVKEDGLTPTTPFDDGSGRVDLNKAGDPGLTFDVGTADYVIHQADLWNVNYPSIYLPKLAGAITLQRTAHSLLSHSTSWKLKVVGATDFTVSVPKNLVVPGNGDATFNIGIDARDVPLGEVRHATLFLTQGARTLHMPITFVRAQAPVLLTKTCDPAAIAKGQTTNCVISFQNTTFSDAQVNVVDTLPSALKLVSGSVTGADVTANEKTLSFSGTLPPALPPDVTVAPGPSIAGYLPLSAFGVGPIPGMGDETLVNFNVPSFTYAGGTYTQLGVDSNGYVVVGGGAGPDNNCCNVPVFPNTAPPNNTLAPFWTDLDPGTAGAVRIGILTDGVDSWIVIDWDAVREFSQDRRASFQIWIGINGTEDISYAYGTIQGNGDQGLLNVGAENLFGNRGQSVYFNGTGTLPTNGTELRVTGTPGAPSVTQTITFSATGNQYGPWVNYAQMTSDLFQGVSTASFAGTVTK